MVLNKTDMLSGENEKQMDSILEIYNSLNYPVIQCSKYEIDTLKQDTINHASILVGQSGVGKSSLINSLCGSTISSVGSISSANEKGKHTTTTAQLYNLSDGGFIIDSPGIREFGLWHLSKNDIIHGFPEFRKLVGHCQFRDCDHEHSHGCAIKAAIEEGSIHPSRVSSYRHIINSIN